MLFFFSRFLFIVRTSAYLNVPFYLFTFIYDIIIIHNFSLLLLTYWHIYLFFLQRELVNTYLLTTIAKNR